MRPTTTPSSSTSKSSSLHSPDGREAEANPRMLGLDVPSDREGVLQDVHWYDGAFGYFPCYSLGAMIAAQLFAAACKAHPEIPAEIEQGRFGVLQGWLKANVHGLGSSRSTAEIVTHATGRQLDVGVFKQHLERRYLA